MMGSAAKRYDAVIVLGTNIAPARRGGFRPTTYADYDQYGMLAGNMSVIAATLLFEHGASETFVFSTGTSEKTKAMYGSGVPTEAEVYSASFLALIKDSSRSTPFIIREKQSVNTYSNLTECIKIINKYGWRDIAVLSARYHIPRVQAIWELASRAKHTTKARVDFLAAETIIIELLPGIHDEAIRAAYNSPEGRKRLASEAQGLRDIQTGTYVVTEFQLLRRD
jgi:hypothetical protein